MAKTLQERFAICLEYRGHKCLLKTPKRWVYDTPEPDGKKLYLGPNGSIRFGRTVAGSVPASSRFKALLLEFTAQESLL